MIDPNDLRLKRIPLTPEGNLSLGIDPVLKLTCQPQPAAGNSSIACNSSPNGGKAEPAAPACGLVGVSAVVQRGDADSRYASARMGQAYANVFPIKPASAKSWNGPASRDDEAVAGRASSCASFPVARECRECNQQDRRDADKAQLGLPPLLPSFTQTAGDQALERMQAQIPVPASQPSRGAMLANMAPAPKATPLTDYRIPVSEMRLLRVASNNT
jgi:hypothetical protein